MTAVAATRLDYTNFDYTNIDYANIDISSLMESEDGYTLYPTDEALELITNFEGTPRQLFGLVKELWYTSDSAHISAQPNDDGEYEIVLVTVGWSGNESIAAALEASWGIGTLCWHSSTRGGRHEYRVRSERWDTPIGALAGRLSVCAGREEREALLPVVQMLEGDGEISATVAERTREMLRRMLVSGLPVRLSEHDKDVVLKWAVGELEAEISISDRSYSWSVTLPGGTTRGEGMLFPFEDFYAWLRELRCVQLRRNAIQRELSAAR